ncbi:hypothetical protein M427DRAFT_58106 [Gonapodya prolifera JEL478]|uniref:Uncharacterized protein n=1 Tax=Gonapodya prolifera (strain JEL478) TaxID=1344416 RepID=A0A139AAH3_GONPJ|nr:hypothetical protein M427DRAFT_58106 [Gonapodya prolifera JEL478]|eukprot:KXS13852.1 hypothetical protein M427DRAFT_58106 [Gonapodya prolifera JEL478]
MNSTGAGPVEEPTPPEKKEPEGPPGNSETSGAPPQDVDEAALPPPQSSTLRTTSTSSISKARHSPAPGPSPPPTEHRRFALADQIVCAAVHCCFVEGLAFPVEEHDEGKGHANFRLVIWAPGVGADHAPSGKGFESWRSEVIMFLTVIGSRLMCRNPMLLQSTVSPSLAPLLSRPLGPLLDKRVVLSLMCSLMNSVVSSPAGNWLLPYDHLVFHDEEGDHLAGVCARAIVAFAAEGVSGTNGPPVEPKEPSPVDVKGKGKAKDTDEGKENTTVPAPTVPGSSLNSFRFYLGKLHRAKDFDLLFGGIVRLLGRYVEASGTLLPGSARRVNLCEDLLLLFWTLADCNPRFLQHVVQHELLPQFLHSVLYLLIESKDDARRLGLARTCCFLTHVLSGEDGMGEQMSVPAPGRLPKIGGTSGVLPASLSDSLVLVSFLVVPKLEMSPLKIACRQYRT